MAYEQRRDMASVVQQNGTRKLSSRIALERAAVAMGEEQEGNRTPRLGSPQSEDLPFAFSLQLW